MPVETPPSEPQTAAFELIKNNVPDWLTHASAPTRAAFKGAPTDGVNWLDNLLESERRQLQLYNATSAQSQNALDQAMAGLPSDGNCRGRLDPAPHAQSIGGTPAARSPGSLTGQ